MNVFEIFICPFYALSFIIITFGTGLPDRSERTLPRVFIDDRVLENKGD